MAYVLRRLLEMIPVLLIVVAATFFLAHAVPGGPFDKDRPLPAEVKARLEKYYGLDQPLPVQLGNYVVNLAQGDLGPSIKYPGWSVREVIGSRIGVSASLGLVSLLLAVLIGVPVGVLAASRPNTATCSPRRSNSLTIADPTKPVVIDFDAEGAPEAVVTAREAAQLRGVLLRHHALGHFLEQPGVDRDDRDEGQQRPAQAQQAPVQRAQVAVANAFEQRIAGALPA